MINPLSTPTSVPDPSKPRLSEKDLKFIEIRRRFLKSTYKMGFILSAFLAGLFFWLLFTMPDMINPLHVQRQITANALSVSFLKVMAVLLPLMVLVAFFLAASIILFGFSAFANERHYLKILDSLLAVQPRKDGLSAANGKDLNETKKKKAIKKR